MSWRNTVLLLVTGLLTAAILCVIGANELIAQGKPVAPFLMRAIVWVVVSATTASFGIYVWEARIDHDLRLVARRVKEMADRMDARGWVAIRTLDEPSELVRSFESLRQHLINTLVSDVRLRAEAEIADRYKTEFLTAISHELRTPLNGILGFTELLLAETEGPLTPGQRENLETVRSAGEHLLSLFNDVIDLSALTSGRVRLEREMISVQPLILDVVRMLEGQNRSDQIEITMRVAPSVLSLYADPKRVRQILTNLGSNALKFTERGSIAFEAVREGQEIILTVTDTGIGIPSEDLARIFEEYTQTGEQRNREPGSGLGLGICKRLTELHGGRIWAESTAGQGSRFYVALPIIGAPT